MAKVFLAFDADNAGRLIGRARMEDDPGKLARISNAIDHGNQVFTSWALEHGGSMISCGGDEGILEVPATALSDLQAIKLKYESALDLTVSIGVGVKMSQAFKALLAAKLRGKNRVVMYDKEVEEEIQKAQEEPEKEKLVKEYLTKAELLKAAPVHHTGGSNHGQYNVQPEGNPEVQQQQTAQELPEAFEVPELNTMEEEFRKLASENENRDRAKTVRKTGDLAKIKTQVSAALQAVHKQLPVLQQIKQASPDTYEAVLSVVQGLIALGKQVSQSEETLQKSISKPKTVWVGGGTRIPALGTPTRKIWDQNYIQAVANYFTDGKVHKLKRVVVPVDKLDDAHFVSGNEAKTRLYHRMVRAGDKMPPMVVQPIRGGRYHITDGNRRVQVARANKLTHVEALIPVMKGEVNINNNPMLPPAGMRATSTGGLESYDLGMDKSDLVPGGVADHLSPEDFDQEQLAIGTQHELEHTTDGQLAQEIAMDHLSEDPEYYKDFLEEDKKPEPLVGKGDGGQEHLFDKAEEPLEKMALMHDDEQNPLTVYRVQNERGEGPYAADYTSTSPFKEKIDLLPTRHTPGPRSDFGIRDLDSTIDNPDVYTDTRFGFHSPQAAEKWFTKPVLQEMEGHGFKLTPVKAKKAWISKTKRQVIFIPHDSETTLNMAKSDWPMSEKEELSKRIEDIPAGPRLAKPVKDNKGTSNAGQLAGYDVPKAPPVSYDYNHLLAPEQKTAGYSLVVDKYPRDSKGRMHPDGDIVSKLFFNGNRVGNVFGGLTPPDDGAVPSLEPHSELAEEHQGKGFGVKMYEALYAHAKHVEWTSVVRGGPHSEAAHRVHVSLAKKHGLNYKVNPPDEKARKVIEEMGVEFYPYKHYAYALKAELGPSDQLDENNLTNVTFSAKEELDPAQAPPPEKVLDKAGLPTEVKSIRQHRKLIPGETLDSRHIVVQGADGKNKIRQVAAGQVRDLNESVGNPTGLGQGSPVSSRLKPTRGV